VALSNILLNIPDVKAEDNYIACSLDVQSELVVPLFVDGKNVGQIDIDSNTPNAFSPQDEHLLTQLCQEIAPHYSPI
jgi:L-methionine (R)-S-oxide reductase